MNIRRRKLPSRFSLTWAPRSRLHFGSTQSCDVMASRKAEIACDFFGCKKETLNLLALGILVVVDDVGL